MNSFKELRLPHAIERALEAMAFSIPTPIQAAAIPLAMSNRDLIACAQTGTGKTAAFCIPSLVRQQENPALNMLVLAPTRELVLQIDAFWRDLTRFAPNHSAAVIIGGAPMRKQIQALNRRPRLIIATPGRLCDHLRQRTVSLSNCGILVLDEADRMLDMGFAPQLNEIMRYVPNQRQTLLFSATWSKTMDDLSKKYLRNPEHVTVGQVSQAATKVEQELISTTCKEKNDALLDELNKRQGSILVFARTQSRTDRVARYLLSYGVQVNRIHGGRTQGQRNGALSAFRSGEIRVLVATDIAARGIDVPGIAHVINYDLPQCPEDYIHRIGRTGRAGASGSAVSLVTPEEKAQWHEIAKLLRKTGSSLPSGAQALDSTELSCDNRQPRNTDRNGRPNKKNRHRKGPSRQGRVGNEARRDFSRNGFAPRTGQANFPVS